MRILFVLKQLGYVRHFESVVRELSARGHIVRLATQDGETDLPPQLAGLPGVSAVKAPTKRGDQWQGRVSLIRRAGDYLRYLEPAFEGAGKLRARAFEKLIGTLSAHQREPGQGWSDVARGLTADERARLVALVRVIEDAIPSDPSIEAFIADEAPDVLLVTPLIDLGSSQADLIKSARALALPSALALFSWDNLTTKGVIHEVPDRLLVWNELQRREARDFHGVPEDRVRVTGAPRFDDFYALQPATTRTAFHEQLGLAPAEKTLLYLGSSKFVAEHERIFVERWLAAVRGSKDPALARANIVMKPHPDVNRMWEAGDARRVTWDGATPLSALVSRSLGDDRAVVVQGRFTAAQLLYDCLAHADAVVALNTSAELEAGILGKPVLTVSAGEEVAEGQESTLHFHYLMREHGGHVSRATSLEAHIAQLAEALAAGGSAAADAHRFINEFLRPFGPTRTPTQVFADEVEALAAERPAGVMPPPISMAATTSRTPAGETAEGARKVRLDYDGCSVWLLVTSPMEEKWRVRACQKEPWTVEWIERLTAGDVLYDIGANVGAFSLLAAKRLDHALRVVAFEPGYANFAKLCDNIVLNGCDGSVIPLSVPLWSSTTMTAFKYRSLDPGQSRHAIKEVAPGKAKDKGFDRYVQPMLAMSLDDVLRQYELPQPTHIKLDVDGAELRVLDGARESLRSPALRSILAEVERELIADVVARMSAAGFRQVATHRREMKSSAPVYMEFARIP